MFGIWAKEYKAFPYYKTVLSPTYREDSMRTVGAWPRLVRAGRAAGVLGGLARGLEGGLRPGGLAREEGPFYITKLRIMISFRA